MPDVVLVAMPFIDLNRPSLALGTLKAILEEAGIATRVQCAYVRFAEMIGAGRYMSVNGALSTSLLGEWVYSRAAFGHGDDNLERVLDLLFAHPSAPQDAELRAAQRARSRDNLLFLRDKAIEHVEETARAVLAQNPRIVGCTSTFQQHVASLALLRRIKELAPEVITMMGGANCEGPMGIATHRNFAWLDVVVSGDADGTIAPLCRTLFAKGVDAASSDLPPGVFAPRHRSEGYGEDPRRPGEAPRSVFLDLDKLPYPDFGDYFETLALSPLGPAIEPGLVIETSRGCWWGQVRHCTFCGLNGGGMAFRSKSPDRAVAEFEYLADQWKRDTFEVVDNILDNKYFATVLPRLRDSEHRWRIFYETKSNLKRAQLRALSDAGIRWIQPGIESLHSKVLSLIDKGAQGFQQVLLLKWAREAGVSMIWNFLWGFPGEEDAWYAEMAAIVPLLAHLEPSGGPTKLRFDRFSPYFTRADDYRLKLKPLPMTEIIYPMSESDRFDQSYFFAESEQHPTRNEDGRPGVQALRRALREWRDSHGRADGGRDVEPPQLDLSDEEGVLRIVDTRPCARQSDHELRGLARAIHLASEEGVVIGRLAGILERDFGLDVSESGIAHAVAGLKEAGLLIELDERYISLALRRRDAPLPMDRRDFPGGHVDLDKAALIERELSHRRNLVEMLV